MINKEKTVWNLEVKNKFYLLNVADGQANGYFKL